MKRITSTYEWKEYQRITNKKVIRRQNRKSERSGRVNTYVEEHKRYFLTAKNPNEYTNLVAPDEFSFVSNTENVLKYFAFAEKTISERKQIILNISSIKRLTSDAIALLIAKITLRSFNRGIKIIGNAPRNEQLLNLFIQSGFYHYVQSKAPKLQTKPNLLLHKRTNHKVEPTIAKQACLIGIRHTFGNSEIYEPLYDILIEAMQNTNNHAGLERKGLYDWWLFVFNDPESKISSYSFLDLGVGIFESLPVKNWRRGILEATGLTSNVNLVDRLISGEISSRTGKAERGKGIPQIYQCSTDKNIKEFIIVSNDVHANLKTKQYTKLSTTFGGTLLYWEIQP